MHFLLRSAKHKVFPSSAGLLLTTAAEEVLETKADNREVDYSELLVNLETRACTACLVPLTFLYLPGP